MSANSEPGAADDQSAPRAPGSAPISVVAPALFGAQVLSRVLQSVRAQEYTGPVELLVVGRAVDMVDYQPVCENSAARLETLQGSSRPGPVARSGSAPGEYSPGAGDQSDPDLAACWNRGLDRASGEILLLLNGDTILPPLFLQRCSEALLRLGPFAVIASPRRPSNPQPAKPSISAPLEPSFIGSPRSPGAPVAGAIDLHTCGAGNLAFRRPVLKIAAMSVDRPVLEIAAVSADADSAGGHCMTGTDATGAEAPAASQTAVPQEQAGIRLEEGLPPGAAQLAFLCRLDDLGCRLECAEDWACETAPREHPATDREQLIAGDRAFLQRHPHAMLQGQAELALERVNGGPVSIVLSVGSCSSRRLARWISVLQDQDYRGEIEILAYSRAPMSRELLEACQRRRVRALPPYLTDQSLDPAMDALLPGLLSGDPATGAASLIPDLASFSLSEPTIPQAGAGAVGGWPHKGEPEWLRAIRAALPVARGHYLFWLDDGVLPTPHHTQNCVNILRCQGDACAPLGRALPLTALLALQEDSRFSRFHLSLDRARLLLKRCSGIERVPARGWGWRAAGPPERLFLSRWMARQVIEPAPEVTALAPFQPDPLAASGARLIWLRGLVAYRMGPPRG